MQIDSFNRGHIPQSVNMPFNQAFAPEGDLVACPAVTQLNNHKGRVIVVVGNRGNNAPNVSISKYVLLYNTVFPCHIFCKVKILQPCTGIEAVGLGVEPWD